MSISNRQPAVRVLASELNAAHTRDTFQEEDKESGDDDRIPKFLVLPSGEGANRVMMTGIVTDLEDVGQDSEYLRLAVTDVAGDTFYAYAGQYAPNAKAKMKALDMPSRVSIVGKPSVYEDDDGNVYVSVTPESIQSIDESEYFRLLTDIAEHTVDRIANGAGSERFQGMADTMHTDSTREDIYESAISVLEEVHGALAEDGEEQADEFTEDMLADRNYDELRSLAAEFDDVNGNAGADAIINGLVGKPVPA
jgi:RPA family protein